MRGRSVKVTKVGRSGKCLWEKAWHWSSKKRGSGQIVDGGWVNSGRIDREGEDRREGEEEESEEREELWCVSATEWNPGIGAESNHSVGAGGGEE
ncbi:hypothetical protein GCM10020229_84810 [Kitasatospora albolonga]